MGKINVLIIDDDVSFCEIYKTLLENTGRYRVATANNGQEGIILAKSSKPDVILLDVVMSNMDGGDVASILQSDPNAKDIPIIFVTAIIKPKEEQKITSHLFLAKPFDPEKLMSTIDSIVKKAY
jgi:CheY-like chemotaxis protein